MINKTKSQFSEKVSTIFKYVVRPMGNKENVKQYNEYRIEQMHTYKVGLLSHCINVFQP